VGKRGKGYDWKRGLRFEIRGRVRGGEKWKS
jgi:hypothetical protein